jgi:hypothetical protein
MQLLNEQFHNSIRTDNIIITKKIKYKWYIATILVGNFNGKRPLERLKPKKGNIKMNHKENYELDWAGLV